MAERVLAREWAGMKPGTKVDVDPLREAYLGKHHFLHPRPDEEDEAEESETVDLPLEGEVKPVALRRRKGQH